MPNVNEFLRSAINEMPDSFVDKGIALRFLDEHEAIEQKEELALELLEAVATFCECHDTWETLVKKRLAPAEKAMRYLLPAHRDHIVHSAHLYLLGLAIYQKMLRSDAALMAVISDMHWRDSQALFGSSQLSYACLPSVVRPGESLGALQERFSGPFDCEAGEIEEILTECPACSPSDGAANASQKFANDMRSYRHCCTPSPHIIGALNEVASAVRALDKGSLCVCNHCPRVEEDVDAVFLRRWGLTAILHDAAYPMELAAKQIGKYVAETVGKLRCSITPCNASFGINLNCLCDFVTIPLLQAVCSERFNPEMFADNSIKLLATNICHKLHVEYSPETLARTMTAWLEDELQQGRVDHGVFSALLMLRRINHEMVNRLGDRRLDRELVFDNANRRVTVEHASSALEYFYIECVDAAAAVYLHNTLTYINLFGQRPVDYREHPMAWLLFLCDQLQEWLRPSGDPAENPLKLFEEADKYNLILDTGPKLMFSYPGDSDSVAEKIRRHLQLFGEDFIIHGK